MSLPVLERLLTELGDLVLEGASRSIFTNGTMALDNMMHGDHLVPEWELHGEEDEHLPSDYYAAPTVYARIVDEAIRRRQASHANDGSQPGAHPRPERGATYRVERGLARLLLLRDSALLSTEEVASILGRRRSEVAALAPPLTDHVATARAWRAALDLQEVLDVSKLDSEEAEAGGGGTGAPDRGEGPTGGRDVLLAGSEEGGARHDLDRVGNPGRGHGRSSGGRGRRPPRTLKP